MSIEATIATLTKLATEHVSRGDFNRAVEAAFGRPLGSGQFRKVYAAGDMVVKIRRAKPLDFPMSKINASNRDEATAYDEFLVDHPVKAMLVLKPTLVTLPNKHDAIIMERVDKVWGKFSCSAKDMFMDKNPLVHNQIQYIQNLFQDAHDGNIGVKGNRAYLIDFNFYQTWAGGPSVADVKRVLRAVGVKFPYGKRKIALKSLEDAA